MSFKILPYNFQADKKCEIFHYWSNKDKNRNRACKNHISCHVTVRKWCVYMARRLYEAYKLYAKIFRNRNFLVVPYKKLPKLGF